MLIEDRLVDLLDRPIAFHRPFVKVTGSITAALMLSQAIYWQRRGTNGSWYKTFEEWEEETGLTRRELETARARLVRLGLLKHWRSGMPARCYYSVDLSALKLSLAETAEQDRRKAPNTDGGNRRTRSAESADEKPETTTETTQSRGARFALDTLPPDWKAFCLTERPDLDPDRVFACFRDHWIAQPGRRGVKLDWSATWRNWVRGERRTNGRQTQSHVAPHLAKTGYRSPY